MLASESRCNLRGEREEINEHHPGPSKEYTNTEIHKCTNTQIHKVIHKFETNTASEAREDIINEQLPGPTEEEIAMCYSSQV